MEGKQQWPTRLLIARHGQSAGNVARDKAEAEGLHLIDMATRDVDVPLSELGQQPARALGRWMGRLPEEERPTAVLASPYLRARETARLAMEAAGLSEDTVPFTVDERLREREFGVLDGDGG